MTAPELDGQAAELTPLQMAQNCARNIARLAKADAADPIASYISRAGEQAHNAADVGGSMALVSIAESLDRIAAALAGIPGPLPQNHLDDAGHVLDDAGHVLDGGASR